MPYSASSPSYASVHAALPRVDVHERSAELISRYPNLSRSQIDELAGLFPRLSALDLSLIMADETLAPRLEAFCAANRQLLAPSLSDYAVIGAIMAFPVLLLLTIVLAS